MSTNRPRTSGLDLRLVTLLIVVLAASILAATWISIRESRSDSLRLMVIQGTALIESLAQAAGSAMAAETTIDHLVHLRYGEITRSVAAIDPELPTSEWLLRVAAEHNLQALLSYDSAGHMMSQGLLRAPWAVPPDFVAEEVLNLVAAPEQRYVLLLDQGEQPGQAVHYYLELNQQMDRVIVVVTDAQYYVDALRQSQIGYLAQSMAREAGVEYIVYQASDGIVFASRKIGNLLAIESDPFLLDILESDSVSHRILAFEERQVLELVRPFASTDYPFGVLRVGLSMANYQTIQRSFDHLMIGLAAVLFLLAIVGVVYVNTRRRRKEITQQFDNMKSITEAIFDEMPTGVAAVDMRGVITMANATFSQVFDMSSVIGRSWNKVVQHERLQRNSLQPRQGQAAELEISRRVRGQERLLLIAISWLDPGPSDSAMIAVVSDITRLRRFERESARKQRLSEMGNLAAGVAHEIRNPLNTISIAAQRLATEFLPAEGGDQFTAITGQIREETRRLNDIITRFLALARDQSRATQAVAIDQFLADLQMLLQSEAAALGIELTIDRKIDATIQAHPDSLRQVFLNLFNNSKEALAGNPGQVRIEARLQKNEVVVLFEDSGPGIPEDKRDEVQQPYFTTKDGGTGLGLPTAHRIITDLGGEMTVFDSKLGGAAISLVLPLTSLPDA